MTMSKIIIYGLAVMLWLYSGLALAEGTEYQVEVIIFSQAMPNTEVFDQTVSQITLPSDLTELSAYKKPENTTLDDSYAALSRDSAYQPISHIAWIQSLGDAGQSAPVHIQSMKSRLNGYIQMQRVQGLQMTVDLEFSSNQDNNSGDSLVYRLNEKRPIKLNEVYYFDHPKFGVIVKVIGLSP
jgi:hypothetical protein